MSREFFIEAPRKVHMKGAGEDEVGDLLVSLCGTRDVAANFQRR